VTHSGLRAAFFIQNEARFHMKNCCTALLSLAFVLSLHAADTPSNMGGSPLDGAREAIAQKNWAGALDRLRAIAPEQASSADFHNLMGYVLRHQSQPNMVAVLDHYERALAIDPGHRQAREYLGEAWLMLHCPDQAAQQLAAIQGLCGSTDCAEWQDLQAALVAYQNPKRHSCSISR
jgi:tetratricopeptide (TPR) repeat protein